MSRKLTNITMIACLAVGLSGCAQISKIGDDLWGYTKSATHFVARPVTKLLRGAPEQHYVFEDASRAQQMAKQAFHADGGLHKKGELIVPRLTELPVPQTPNYQAPIYSPQSYQSAYGNPPVTPRRVVEAQPQALLAAPKHSNDISFVKIGGGSNMQDWITCEADAGGFIHVFRNGYVIDPAFENCMRAKGYKLESELTDVINKDWSL